MNPGPALSPSWYIGARLKLRHLRLLDTLSRTSTLLDAATGLGISQPAASKLLSDLEDMIGFPLFLQDGRRMRFSVFGEVLARRAAVILNELDRAREEINILLSGSTGRVSIGTIDGPAVDLLTSIIFRLQKNFPGIDLEIRTGSSIGLFGDLLRGEVDIMIGRPPEDASPQDFTIRNAGREPMVLAARPKHPLAGRKKRDIRDIANYPLILQRRGGRSRLRLETLFQEAGIPLPSSVIGSDSLVVTLACIADSDALTILSEPVALQQERYHQITGIPTAFDLSISSYGILTSVVRPPTPAARMVMTLLLEAADGDESPMSEENPTAPQAQDSFLEE